MNEDQAKKAAEQILTELDKLTLLGAALDCMSEKGIDKLKSKMVKIMLREE